MSAKISGLSYACHENCIIRRQIKNPDEFMSPEIALSCQFDKSVDIYSFGMILCELLTLKEPFSYCDSDTPTSSRQPLSNSRRMMSVFKLNFNLLSVLKSTGCPERLEMLACHCCNSDPLRRPSVHTCIDELIALLTNLTESEKGTNFIYSEIVQYLFIFLHYHFIVFYFLLLNFIFYSHFYLYVSNLLTIC